MFMHLITLSGVYVHVYRTFHAQHHKDTSKRPLLLITLTPPPLHPLHPLHNSVHARHLRAWEMLPRSREPVPVANKMAIT